MESKPIIGVGIDQGIANCGFSVVELIGSELRVLESGTLITKSTYPLSQRCLILYDNLNYLLKNYNVDIIGCEKLFFNPKMNVGDNHKKRNKSASIVYTNMVTGLLYLLAGQYQIPIKEFVPGTVKKTLTNNGRASKEEVEEAVIQAVLNHENPLHARTPKTSHESDSIGIGITSVKFYQKHKEIIIEDHKHKKPRKRKE